MTLYPLVVGIATVVPICSVPRPLNKSWLGGGLSCLFELMAKSPKELIWIESDILYRTDYLRKNMFGGFGYYLGQKIFMAIFENEGDFVFKDKTYNFEIWRGCLFPIEKEFHAKALQKFLFLFSHPVLKKWLYLPLNTENFDDCVIQILRDVIKPNSFWGVIVKPKKLQKKLVTEKSKKTKNISAQDMRTPKMFSDLPLESKKKI